ncbi:hypothetical protein CARUB_v10025070mg [Capsella rubella]|uniref:TF-B3 domain-containing protein n=1 Tax=Capsella rubella TaxID=81985 RepID=R0G0U8_9BRAS|nr:hypothetical protein CARUB_v10025070mg [Capsella rubella]
MSRRESSRTTEKSELCFYWKLDMLFESARNFFKVKARRPVDIPKPENSGSTSTPEWLVEVMREKKGYNPKLILIREVQKTDLDKTQSCLSIHDSHLESLDFLTEEETRVIRDHWSHLKKQKGSKGIKQSPGLRVDLVDHKLNEYKVHLRRWNTKYVLNRGWNDVIDSKTIAFKDNIQLWSFRDEHRKLWFALSPPTRRDQKNSSSKSFF